MTRWGVTAGCVLLAVVAAGCGGDDEPAEAKRSTTTASTTTVPDRPVTTPSTIYAPDSVEGQVEAAYLESWEVYADAVYHLRLDEEALAEVFADPLLSVRRTELADRVDRERAALVRVDHDYEITITGVGVATVVDTYRNHQVLIDPGTKEPIEPDPDKTIVDVFTLRLASARWVVADQQRLT